MSDMKAELAYLEANRSRYASVAEDPWANLPAMLDAQAERQPDAIFVITDTSRITWRSFQEQSWRVAHALRELGVRKGDAVALNMENDIAYLVCLIGILRVGAIAGLINTNLTGRQLLHCVRETRARVTIVGNPGLEAIRRCGEEYRGLNGGQTIVRFDVGDPIDLGSGEDVLEGPALLATARAAPLDVALAAADPALYIFTSGTTGFPKAAIMRHGKVAFGAATMATVAFRATERDRMYNCLPLYHGTGLLVGAASCMVSGSSMFLRRRFSASALVSEANAHGCTTLVYIGEVCRYLLQTPERADDPACTIERAAGNGLRADIWRTFKARFGLDRICEFYGASEAVGGFINVFNKDESIGITAATARLVEYNVDDASVVRDEHGRARETPRGVSGLLLFEVNGANRFDGYTDEAQSAAKLERNVFRDGDCWFNSGDLLKTVDVGEDFGLTHYQFVDRLGDTFRWKSENVATNDVAEALCTFPAIAMACVYGVEVPGADGRAGMAALATREDHGLDLDALARHLEDVLPRYARPLFLRVCKKLDTTGTHKIVKSRYVSEAYDIARARDPIFAWDASSRAYVLLNERRLSEIRSGRSGY